MAVMYLGERGEWRLPPLNGITTTPLLDDDGTIRSVAGYDVATGVWCDGVPDVGRLVPLHPTQKQAAAALLRIRKTFRAFCFADAKTVIEAGGPYKGIVCVDTSHPPGQDESSFLAALLTAVCRPRLWLAPGLAMRGAPFSGSGSGKGKLARAICTIAFGVAPAALTAGETKEELEKRIAACLIEGGPAILLDNMNNMSFKSAQLESAITERPTRVRPLGHSKTVPLCATAMIILNGNGLSLSTDMARRCLTANFDAGMEDAETRDFKTDFLAEVREGRLGLLADMLTIWRWGRQTELKSGKPLGSYEQWGVWVRDPLLALGCADPVEQLLEGKRRDSAREYVGAIFEKWWVHHKDSPMQTSQLDPDVTHLIDPKDEHGRQYIASYVARLVGTRPAGFVLTCKPPNTKWGRYTYQMQEVEPHSGAMV
jgi:hypothetical protein